MVEHNGFYKTGRSSGEQQFVKLERIQFVGACNPPTDPGRKPLSHRWMCVRDLNLSLAGRRERDRQGMMLDREKNEVKGLNGKLVYLFTCLLVVELLCTSVRSVAEYLW